AMKLMPTQRQTSFLWRGTRSWRMIARNRQNGQQSVRHYKINRSRVMGQMKGWNYFRINF
ncbi:hypothetical protein DXG01_009089, partial [Tephrocybe rancida]